MMPKAKPTQVIVHRIELQEKERDMLEVYVAGKTARNMVEPAVAVAGAYVAYKSAKALHGWGEDLVDNFNDKVQAIKTRYEEEGVLWESELQYRTNLDGTVTFTDPVTGEEKKKKAYPLPYYWLMALVN